MILLLCVAVYFLFKSMSKHLKRVRDDFPSDGTTGVDAPPRRAARRRPRRLQARLVLRAATRRLEVAAAALGVDPALLCRAGRPGGASRG